MVTPTFDDTAWRGQDDSHGEADTQRLGVDTTIPRQATRPNGAQPRGQHSRRPRVPTPRRPNPLLGLRERPWRQLLTYPVLYAMAAADAFGFWNTLSQIIKRNASLVLVFVMALSIGAVAASSQVGRLVRSRREGYGGSVVWIAVLSILWLCLGLTIAWLRWTTPTSVTGFRTGQLAKTVAAAGSGTNDAAHIAVLLLVLFLLTGVLAMTHGYRFGDPRTPEVKALLRQRMKLERDLAEHRREAQDAEGDVTAIRDNRKRAEHWRSRAHEIDEAHLNQLRNQARNDIAGHVGNPSGTDELHQDWTDTPPPRRPDPYDDPAEI